MSFDVCKQGGTNAGLISCHDLRDEAIAAAKSLHRHYDEEYCVIDEDDNEVYNTSNDEDFGSESFIYIVEAVRGNGGDINHPYTGRLANKAISEAQNALLDYEESHIIIKKAS